MPNASTRQFAQLTYVLLRIVVGGLLFQHGAQKLFGWFGPMAGAPAGGVKLLSALGVAGMLEFGGGIALVLGAFTTPVAFLLSGELAVAYFTVHQPMGTWPIQNHGELAALYSFVLLSISARGAGAFSVDAARRHRH
jgi:putative oxidoreductase